MFAFTKAPSFVKKINYSSALKAKAPFKGAFICLQNLDFYALHIPFTFSFS